MSKLDYSKWDNIELSDDEDFECHPNVDKPSMVRWKQAEIYRVRRERNDKIELCNREISLNKSVLDKLGQVKEENILESLQRLKSHFDKVQNDFDKDAWEFRCRQRDSRWRDPEPIPIFEKRVVAGLYVQQVIDGLDSSGNLKESLDSQVKKLKTQIEARNKDLESEIAKEQAEANKRLTSENMYQESFSTKAVPNTQKKKETVIETIHDPSNASLKHVAPAESNEPAPKNPDAIASPAAAKFAKIKTIEESYKYLGQHPDIVNQKTSDDVLAEAFSMEMNGDTEMCKRYVHQALLLQYCALLGNDGVTLFFRRIETDNHKAKTLFLDDVKTTYTKIVNRVKELEKNQKEEEELERQLAQKRIEAATQPDGTYALPISAESTEEDRKRSEAFAKFPSEFQRALLSQDVDLINAAINNTPKEDLDDLMKLASESGLLEIAEEGDEEEATE